MIDHIDAIGRFADARSRIDLGGRTPVPPSYLTALALPCRTPRGGRRAADGTRPRFAQLDWLARRERAVNG
jgi:hypothetical protein